MSPIAFWMAIYWFPYWMTDTWVRPGQLRTERGREGSE